MTRNARMLVLAVLGLAGACRGMWSSGPTDDSCRNEGIVLDPPTGTGERALRCQPDHAPLRRLSHLEYQRTLRDLFPGVELPSDLNIVSDQRREGFTNNYVQSLAADHVYAFYDNANRLATLAAPSAVSELACANDAACFDRFVADTGLRMYRRPLTDAERTIYGSIFREGPLAGDFARSIELALAIFLQAPETLYRAELGGSDAHLTQYEVASRLSYFVWGSMPDAELFSAAQAGSLQGDGLRAQVERMLRDDKAREGLMRATSEWLGLERLDIRRAPLELNFTADVREHLRMSIERFMWEQVFTGENGIDAFYRSNGAYVDSTIGPIYGITDAGPELAWRELPNRYGILTHPGILAMLGDGDTGSPVDRGAFVLRELLCDPPGAPPPGAAMTEIVRMDPMGRVLTNREAYELTTEQQPLCASCHTKMNPFGFALESYDTIGAFRTLDNGQPINTRGESHGFTLCTAFNFADARDLTDQLAHADRARACLVDRWVRYAAGGGPLAYDRCWRESLETVAAQPNISLRDLIIAIAVDPRFAAAEVVQ